MMSRHVYGFPELVAGYWRKDIDFYVLSNEDIGFLGSLVTGTNEIHNFALPYPATVDLSEETIVVYALEFLMDNETGDIQDLTKNALMAYLSFLDKDFVATFRGIGADAEDEALKSKFASHIVFGQIKTVLPATVSVEGASRSMDGTQQAIYYPPMPLDLLTPLFVDLLNISMANTLATNAVASATFTFFERVRIIVWFTKRRLSSFEKSAKLSGVRFARLDA